MSDWKKRAVKESGWKSRAVVESSDMKDAVAQPSGNTPPPDSNFEVAGRYNTPGATPSYAPPPMVDDGSGFSATRALLTNDPTQGIAEDFVRGAPAAFGGMAGTIAGAGALSIPAAGLGAAGGEGLRQAAVGLTAIAQGKDAPTTGQVLKNMGAQGATGAAGQAVGLAAGPVLKAVGRGMVNNPVSRAVGGYTKEAADRLMSYADDVVKNIGTTDEMGGKTYTAAGKFKQAVAENLNLAGEKYRALMKSAIQERAGDQSVFIPESVATKADSILEDYGIKRTSRAIGAKSNRVSGEAIDAYMGKPASPTIPDYSGTPFESQDVRMVSSAQREGGGAISEVAQGNPDKQKFIDLYDRLMSLTQRNSDSVYSPRAVSSDDIYAFQRDLNTTLRESNSQALNKKLGALKGAVDEWLVGAFPKIREGNAIFRNAAGLAEDLSRIDGADDASKAILSRYRAQGSDTRQAILDAAKQLPAAQEALDSLLNLESAKQFSKGMPDIPRTGFGATMLMGLNQVFNPAAVATGAMGAAGVSPLATAYAVKGASAASRMVPAWAAKTAAPAAGYAGSRVGELLGATQPQLSPNMQAVLEAANRR